MTFTDEFTFTSMQLVSIFYMMLRRFVGLLINTHDDDDATLHSSNEPDELSQWPRHDDSTGNIVITFRVSRRPREMYCGHARLCVFLCRGRMPTLLHGPGCNLA